MDLLAEFPELKGKVVDERYYRIVMPNVGENWDLDNIALACALSQLRSNQRRTWWRRARNRLRKARIATLVRGRIALWRR